jgi:hypothetical protein
MTVEEFNKLPAFEKAVILLLEKILKEVKVNDEL